MGKRQKRYRIPDDGLEEFLARKPGSIVAPILGDTTGRWPDPVTGPWEAEFFFNEDGPDPVLTGLTIRLAEGEPARALTRTMLLELPWSELVATAIKKRSDHALVLEGFGPNDEPRSRPAIADRYQERWHNTGTRGHPPLSDQFMLDILWLIRDAERRSERPKEVIMSVLGGQLGESTVRRYMSLARRKERELIAERARREREDADRRKESDVAIQEEVAKRHQRPG